MFTFVITKKAMNYETIYIENKEQKLHGRYITLNDIEPVLNLLNTNNELKIIGKSVLGKPIYRYKIGNGKTKILLWSQMHGNESTTTKSLFDFLKLLKNNSELSNSLLDNYTFCSIPMLNPDGSELYTRENANNVDLNRDFQDFSQPESRLLQDIFNDFKPDYCYNLHDQRTIYGVGDSGKPATVSFLAPAFNENRDYNSTRMKAVSVIVAMNLVLQRYIPSQIGRFDDSYNKNCAGDSFQLQNVPTILFEAGHFAKDYEREQTRKFIFIALLASCNHINEIDVVDNVITDYLNISQNKVNFYDFVCKNSKINYDSSKKSMTFAAQYKEELSDGKIQFNSYIDKIDDLDGFFGHVELDAENLLYEDENGFFPQINAKTNFRLGNKYQVVNGEILQL